MTIADLFINLGVKGTDKSKNALKDVKGGMTELYSESLAAKAAIVAAIYALQKLMSQSSAVGTALTNFKSLTGLSATELQRWEFGMRQAGMSAEETAGNVKHVQDTMAAMASGKGAPEGMNRIAQAVGFDPKKMADTFYVMDKLRQYAQQTAKATGNDLAIANQAMRSFGASDNFISAARRGKLDEGVRNKAPLYSDREAEQMSNVGVAWSNLGQKIEMAVGHLNAKHGLQIVQDLSKITDQVVRLIDALTVLGEKLKVFQLMAGILDVVAKTAQGAADLLDSKKTEKEKTAFPSPVGALWHAGKVLYDNHQLMKNPMAMGAAAGNAGKVTNNNVKIDIHGVKDGSQAAGEIQREINRTLRQMSAQGQGS